MKQEEMKVIKNFMRVGDKYKRNMYKKEFKLIPIYKSVQLECVWNCDVYAGYWSVRFKGYQWKYSDDRSKCVHIQPNIVYDR